ncbi:MAG: insulinase family protein, partial [Leptospira sp.]|nr:insulinase family protein [Leptospira sp.]
FSEIMILAEKYFSAKIGIGPATYNYPEVKKDFSVNFENKDLEQINFVLAAQGFKRDFDSSVVSSLVTSIIGGGMSSRLFQRIREELGLCYSINCYSSSYFDTGITSISCGTSKEKFMFCVESIMAELRRLVKDGFTESELRDAKSSQIGAMAIGFELPEQRMGSLALQEIYFSRFYNFEERKAAMEKVTLEMLNAKMREIFNLKSLHLSGVGDLGKSIIPDNLVIF